MKLIKIADVIIGEDRQRKEFTQKPLDTLADSIARLGLFHPIVLENDAKTLRVGERRLRAISGLTAPYRHDGHEVPPGFIPFTMLAELSEAELCEIELEENIQRVDISFQERARAYQRLFELQQRMAGPGVLVTVADLGRTLHPEAPKAAAGAAYGYLKVAPHLDDPEVAGAKTLKEAENIIRRKNEAIIREELLTRIGAVESPHKLFNESAFAVLPRLPDNSVDIILTDPPYGIDMDQMATQSGSSSGLVHDYKDDIEYARTCVELLAAEGKRVGKASCVCYMFCDIRLWDAWARIFESEDWYVWPFPVIWNKAPVGSILGRANGPRHVYEAVLIAIRGNRPVNFVGEDVISISGPQQNKRHPAEKPVALYEKLLSWSAAPGDVVADFFCGCGPVFEAANSHGCKVIACELNKDHYSVAELRRQGAGRELV